MEERVSDDKDWRDGEKLDWRQRVALGSFALLPSPSKVCKKKSGNATTQGCRIERRKAARVIRSGCAKGTDPLSSTRKTHFHLLSSLGKSRDPRLPKPRLLLSVSKLFISLS